MPQPSSPIRANGPSLYGSQQHKGMKAKPKQVGAFGQMRGQYDNRPGTTGQVLRLRMSNSTPTLGGPLHLERPGGFAEEKKIDSRAQSLLDSAQHQKLQSNNMQEQDAANPTPSHGINHHRRNSDPKSLGGSLESQASESGSPHPSIAFARPATSHASMQSSFVDPKDAEDLREEVKRLQLAMVDQFRGKGRFTGGSQFRVRQLAPDNSERSAEMNSLRAAVKNLRQELKNAKNECEDLEKCSSEDRIARSTAEEQLRREHTDAVSLKQELDRIRALLEASQVRERGSVDK